MYKLLPWLAAPLCFALVAWVPFFEALDWRGLDPLVPEAGTHPDIVVLAVDNRSITELGRWPWSRDRYADLFAVLKDAKPRAIGIDIMFSETSSAAEDAAFARALSTAEFPVVLPVEETVLNDGTRRPLLPLEAFRGAVELGHVHVPPDPGGLARFFPATQTVGGAEYPAFAAALATSLGADDGSNAVEGKIIAFAGPAGTVPTYSVTDVLSGRVPDDVLRDAIVLLGATASDLHDTVNVPVGDGLMSGVEWHATVLSNMLLRSALTSVPRWVTFAVSLALALVVLAFFYLRPMRDGVAATVLGIAIVLVLSAVLARAGILFPFVVPVLSIAGTALAVGLARSVAIDREKRRLRRTLKNYFSPRVMEAILTSPDADVLGAKRAEVSVFFSDIRNFTTISESSEPELLASLLQEYFTAMSEEIHKTDGVLEKFVGDAIMAFWGAPIAFPDHAERAVQSAVAMYERFLTLRADWEKRGIGPVDIGMSVNTGPVLVGNLGSRVRFNYGILGDTVNTAARIEGLNKEFKTHLLIGKRTEELLPPGIVRIDRGEVMVKGKTKAIRVFEIPIGGVR